MNVRELAGDVGFAEGPTITSTGDIVIVSIDHRCVYRVGPHGKSVLGRLGGGPNGATADHADVVYVAQNGGNWMRNPDPDRKEPGMTGGVQRVVGDEAQWVSRGPLAPNDLCFGPDGMLYVTDPTRDGKYDDGRIWRIDPVTGCGGVIAHVSWFCNGIGFGADDLLYVASSGDRRIMRFSLNAGRLSAEEKVCQLDGHAPDGFAFDLEGNLAIGALSRGDYPGEVQIFGVDGKLLDRVRVGEGLHYTNVALSGDNCLVVCDSGSGRVLCVEGWPGLGLSLYPRRNNLRSAPKLFSSIVEE
jgi:gluconolactonase